MCAHSCRRLFDHGVVLGFFFLFARLRFFGELLVVVVFMVLVEFSRVVEAVAVIACFRFLVLVRFRRDRGLLLLSSPDVAVELAIQHASVPCPNQ